LNILKTHPFFIEHYHLTLDLSHHTNNSCEKTIAKQFFSQEAAHPRGLSCLKKTPSYSAPQTFIFSVAECDMFYV